eukprot:CAMPEP_0168413326 /NCGR_PEP_ID=MMETSP0228-20121227/29165_1 /TAXON_ID=133427 /ORGANISM="Protoceratium reticulatum, Strain CCCM 535 (=CCMP 1889)" /LENGTH=190 /DNA_ID=CAMNT_0008427113 /DNA_START=10 /DNA_END=582 /DNA_ORIENTATION=+
MAEEAPATSHGELSAADLEIEEMQKKVQEMEEEAEKLKKLTDSVEETSEGVDREEVDKRSVYVGNVDYGSTPEEVQEHFKSCGQINRITILVDKYSGSPKGFAYIEFADEQSVQNSLLLNGSLFRARQLKVIQKRTNIPGWNYKGSKGKAKGKGKGKGGMWMGPWMDPYWGYGYMPWRPRFKGKGKYSPY